MLVLFCGVALAAGVCRPGVDHLLEHVVSWRLAPTVKVARAVAEYFFVYIRAMIAYRVELFLCC